MPRKTDLKAVVSTTAPLFKEIEVNAIPKQHKGNFNKNYETVLTAFKTATSKAIEISVLGMGEELKAESVAHSFRMKINELKLNYSVQLHKDRNVVYLIKR